jgi:hypothetical protein
MHGISYFYIVGGIIITGFVMMEVYLPVFHDLKLTSTYQVYKKMRKSLIMIAHCVRMAGMRAHNFKIN